jgi:hypothetical protein
MPRIFLPLLALASLAVATVSAADFWIEKPFLEWSDRDAEKLMTGSPWAAIVSVALPPTLPVPVDGGGGGRGGGRGGDGGDGGDGFGPGPRRIRLTISWRSALPYKQALVRAQVGQGGTLTADHEAFLSQEEPFYVVGVTGLPPQYVRPGTAVVEAFLRRRNLPDIPAAQAGTQRSASGLVLLVGFPRGAIAPEDNEVEFVAKFDRLEVKRKFKLKEMTFEGRLEL